MRDISSKIKTLRIANAVTTLTLKPETLSMIRKGEIPKGDPLEVAKVAAIQAAKQTSSIIPYCHPLPLDFVAVEFELRESSIEVTVSVKAIYKTGVEMEALCGVSVAALTLYDMLKMLDDSMEIRNVRLTGKKGGKSDFRKDSGQGLQAAVLVISKAIAEGSKDDKTGRMIIERLEKELFEVSDYKIISEDRRAVVETLTGYADNQGLDLVLTTGGTAFSRQDVTPEATGAVIEREIPGIPEALRSYGQERTPYSMLSRGKSGIRGKTIIINLPGSSRGAAESLDALFPGLLHSFKMLRGEGHEHG